MNTIVLATDGSPSSAKAAATAIELAQATGAPLHVVTAWSIPASAFGYGGLTAFPELGDAERERAETAADAAVEQAEAAGLSVRREVGEGNAVDVICAAAERHDAGLIVIGAHGWGALARLVFGSVSTGVLHRATHPVLVVRGAQADAAKAESTA
ncbi:MAG: universal stress protein [Gaiellaceae bacterium]